MERRLTHTQSIEEPVCSVCQKKFKDPEKLSLHMRFHSLFGNFKKTPAESMPDQSSEEAINDSREPCEQRRTSKKTKSRLAQSVLLVEKPFRCTKCGVNFSSMRNKMQHDLLHAKKTSGFQQRGTYTTELKCGICKKRCRTENGLQRHFEAEHTDLHENGSTACKICSKKFRNKASLELHVESKHSSEKQDDLKPTNSLAAVDSRVSKSSWVNFESVIVTKKTSNKNVLMYKCKLCDTLCFTVRSIKLHMKKDHLKMRKDPAMCEQCGKVLAGSTELKRHITMMHKSKEKNAGEIPSPANDEIKIDSKEVQKNALKSPSETSASLQKTECGNQELFHCESCSISFPTAVKMKRHLKERHSRHALHKFNYAIKGFKRFKVGYNWTNGSSRFAYQCLLCKKQTNVLEKISAHVKSEHKFPFQGNKSSDTEVGDNGSDRQAKSIALCEDSNSSVTKENSEEIPSKLNCLSSETKLEPSKASRRKGLKKSRFGTKKLKQKGSQQDPCHCLDCGVLLKTEWELDHHYKTIHSGPNYQVVPKYSVVKGKYNLFLKCLICGKMCRSKGILKQHLRVHEKSSAADGTSPASSIPSSCGSSCDVSTAQKATNSRKSGIKRSGSCIYHCRTCGNSFPRLFSYNEHICLSGSPDGCSKESSSNAQNVMEVALPRVANGTFGSGAKEVKDGRQANKQSSARINQEKKACQKDGSKESSFHRELSIGGICDNNQHKASPIQSSPAEQGFSKCTALPRPPWASDNSHETRRSKFGERGFCNKYSCSFCKRRFPHQKQLVKHEKMHTETRLHACSNCGMSFTALHKLRYHSMRCILNQEAFVGQTGVPNSPEPLSDSFNGRVNGNTYPSYARKSEYTFFDPANRPEEVYLNENIILDNHSLNTGDGNNGNHGSSFTGSTQSSLDNIVIADVRSYNPSFSNGYNKGKYEHGFDAQVDVPDDSNLAVVQSGNSAAEFDLDQVGRTHRSTEFEASQAIHPLTPDLLQQNMYARGTVLLVPYFVPAPETYAKDGDPFTVAPKPSSLPPGSFIISPNEFSARISPCGDWKFVAQPMETNFRSQLPVHVEGYGSQISTVEEDFASTQSGHDSKWKDENKSYDCGVCDESFSTFGNFIKHRETHRN